MQLLIVLVAVFVVVNALWIWVNRYHYGLVLDIDEAGYFCYALTDYYALHYGGLAGWIRALGAPSIQAPLTMALTSLIYAFAGLHILYGFAVPLAAGAGCVAAAYALGKSMGPNRSALLGALLTACCPVIINYSRSYLFATPAAFFATMALVAILRSRNFSSIAWALGFGVCLGLMPLARTMTVAFVPGLVLAALVSVVAGSGGRVLRLLRLCLGILLGFVIAVPWFWKNGALVAHYLFNYGYTTHAVEYGPKVPMFGVQAFSALLHFVINAEIYFPDFLVLCLGLLALVVIVVRAIAATGTGATLHRIVVAPVLPVVIFNGMTLLALASSTNTGSGFLAPIVPAMMVQTGWALWRLWLPQLARNGVYLLAIGGAVVSAVPLVALSQPFAPLWKADLPLIGGSTITNGFGNIQKVEVRGGYGNNETLPPMSRKDSLGWVRLSASTAAILTQTFGPQAGIMFAFRKEFYNVNTVNMQALLAFHSAFAVQQIDPIETGTSEAGYQDWLVKDGMRACGVLTSEEVGGDIEPVIDPDFIREAAVQAGFVPVNAWLTPDGQRIVLWRHKVGGPECIPAAR